MTAAIRLSTEALNETHRDLDQYDTPSMIAAFVDDQTNAVAAVRRITPELAHAVEAALPRIRDGGRLIYVGAGTSGRLGLLDSVELLPTFSWPEDRALSLLAGGRDAVYRAVEGAEDSSEQGALDVDSLQPTVSDVLIAIAASGSTPYVLGAIAAAKRWGALTIGFANNAGSQVATHADIDITLDTGPEVISGSTRLKAGTAQKIALNAFSSSLMVRLNKVYGNLMVDVKPTNAKLIRRCVNLTILATGCDEGIAKLALEACVYQVKTAIVMIEKSVDAAAASEMLSHADGSVRRALVAGQS
jgi:N-acetylmuramic acid 6-phosphate etherase